METLRFLIVDPEAKQAEIYSGFIREVTVGAEIHSVTSGEAALEKMAANNYQLIVFDSAAVKDSMGTIERIRASSPNSGLIVTSASASIDQAVKVMRMGADDYYPKPVSPDQFKLSVRRVVDRRDLFTADGDMASFMNLINASQLISASLDETRVSETIASYLKRETNCRGLALYKKQNGTWSRMTTSSDADVDVIQVAMEWSNALDKCVEDGSACTVIPKSVVAPEILLFHYKWVADRDCVVVCTSPELKQGVDQVFSRFKMLHVQIQLTAKNISNYLAVRDLLYRDDATSLHNARYLNLSLDRAFEQQAKSGKKFAVLFVDVDKFKSVNDGHGHMVGTKLLNEIGEVLKKEVRGGDTVCRYGGDEFVVILNNVEQSIATEIAERIRKNVESRSFLSNEGLGIHLTVSIGVAICPDHARSKVEIVTAADLAMYEAKRASKNMVYVTGGPKKSVA